MAASERVGQHLRRNAIAYAALFIALTGTSYAATKVTSKDIARDAVKAKHVKDGQLGTAEVADNALTGADIDEATLQNLPVQLADGSVTTVKLADAAVTLPKLAFDPATQTELDALASPGTVNAAGNPVDFSKLKGVPAGFADGVDDTGGALGDNSVGAAEPPAADDQIVDGSIDAQDVSSEVALRDVNQTFTAENTFADDLTVDLGSGEDVVVNATRTGTDFFDPFGVSLTNNTSGSIQRVAAFANSAGTGETEQILSLTNFDGDSAVGTGILLGAVNGGTMTTAVEASDADIGTALDVGANDIETNTATISAAELAVLDGAPLRSISLPLGNFFNTDTNATLDFASGADNSPDLGAVAENPYIEWDAAGAPDNERVTTQFVVPSDYASGGAFHLRYREFGNTPATTLETIACDASRNDGSFTIDSQATTGTAGFNTANLVPAITYAAGDVVALRCDITDGGGGSPNDPVRIHSFAFEYQSTR
jgi:hypothetical protein